MFYRKMLGGQESVIFCAQAAVKCLEHLPSKVLRESADGMVPSTRFVPTYSL